MIPHYGYHIPYASVCVRIIVAKVIWPNMNYSGTDSFTYKAYDGTSYSNTMTVSLNVTSVCRKKTAN